MHSVWAGTPGVPLARCGCSVLNDRGTEAEETSPGALHHAILRRRVGLIAPSFCAQYEHPWHRALVHSLCSLAALLQAAVFMFKRWWVLVRLLASKYDSWGEFLTPLFWTWYARSGVRYFHMHSIKSPESRWFFTVRMCERWKESWMQLLLNSSGTAHQRLNSASPAPLSAELLVFDSIRSHCTEVILKRGARQKRKESAFLENNVLVSSAWGLWECSGIRLTNADWSAHIGAAFPSSLAWDLSSESSHISPLSPLTRSVLTPPRHRRARLHSARRTF